MTAQQELGQAIVKTFTWVVTVVITAPFVYPIPFFILHPFRNRMLSDDRKHISLIIALIISLVLSFTWWLQPVRMVYDSSAPPF